MTTDFVPGKRYISDISNAQFAVVTTTEDHNFTDGEIVSFRVSKDSGMFEMNEKQAKVLLHTSDTITVNIDSMNFTPFVAGLDIQVPPMVVPSSSSIIPDSDPATVNLEDAFDNRSTP